MGFRYDKGSCHALFSWWVSEGLECGAWGSEQGPFPRSWVSLAGSQIGQQNPDKANAFPSPLHCPLPWEPSAPAQEWVGCPVVLPSSQAIRLLAAVLARGVTLLAGSTSSWRRLFSSP